jgi:hypothetical protein
MNITTKLKQVLRPAPMIAGAFAGLLIASTVVWFGGNAHGVSLGSIQQDCDTNAVISCGAADTATLITRYNADATVQDIYSGFGITKAEVGAMGTIATVGKVTKTGEVWSGSKLVATNAITAGRENLSGSTKKTTGKTTYYERSPSVSFATDSLPAFVVMQNGTFAYAIIGSCANPVRATPKAPAPKPKKPTFRSW